jgi:hypothetical protein
MLGRISTIFEIIVNCIVCEREIGILASSLAWVNCKDYNNEDLR